MPILSLTAAFMYLGVGAFIGAAAQLFYQRVTTHRALAEAQAWWAEAAASSGRAPAVASSHWDDADSVGRGGLFDSQPPPTLRSPS